MPEESRSRAHVIARSIAQLAADLLGRAIEENDWSEPFSVLGLDSQSLLTLTGDLSASLEIELEPTAAYDHSSIWELARFAAALEQGQSPEE